MKHEMDRRHRLSSDIFADSNGTKLIFHLLARQCNENCLQGYIQKINYDPFGILMISDIQVNIDLIRRKVTNQQSTSIFRHITFKIVYSSEFTMESL